MPLFSFSRRPNVQELKSQGDVNGLIEALDYGDDHNIRLLLHILGADQSMHRNEIHKEGKIYFATL